MMDVPDFSISSECGVCGTIFAARLARLQRASRSGAPAALTAASNHSLMRGSVWCSAAGSGGSVWGSAAGSAAGAAGPRARGGPWGSARAAWATSGFARRSSTSPASPGTARRARPSTTSRRRAGRSRLGLGAALGARPCLPGFSFSLEEATMMAMTALGVPVGCGRGPGCGKTSRSRLRSGPSGPRCMSEHGGGVRLRLPASLQ